MRVPRTPLLLFVGAVLCAAAHLMAQTNLPASAEHPAKPDTLGCPLTFSIDALGKLYEGPSGNRIRISQKTLVEVLHNGCKRTGPPTSVTLEASPRATFGKVQHWLELIQQNAPEGVSVRMSETAKP